VDTLERLQAWYLRHCDGEWEHRYGVKIGNLDNPGWMIDIDLTGTSNERQRFEPVKVERSEHDWIDARIQENQVRIRCGPSNLDEALRLFLDWATPG